MHPATDLSRVVFADTLAVITSPSPVQSFLTSTSTLNKKDGNANNMTREEIQEYLEILQNEELLVYIPALTFLLLLAVLGLSGNILVLLVYKYRFKKSPKRIFIMAIAVFDLIGSVICIPIDVNRIFHLWTYTQTSLCRLDRFTTCSVYMISGGFLLGLAVDRYLKICRPFGKQITVRHAKVIIIGFVVFGWMSSILYTIINGTHTRPTPRPGVFGHSCTIDDAFVDTKWPLINNAFFFLLFISVVIPMITIYLLIGVKIFKHRNMYNKNLNPQRRMSRIIPSEDSILSSKSKRKNVIQDDDSTKCRSIWERIQKDANNDRFSDEVGNGLIMKKSNSFARSSVDVTDNSFSSDNVNSVMSSQIPDQVEEQQTFEIDCNRCECKLCPPSRCQCLDITTCRDNTKYHTGCGENDLQVTVPKKTSNTRKPSMEKILLQKQIGIRDGFMKKSDTGQKDGNDNEHNLKVDMEDEGNSITESENDVTYRTKTLQDNTQRWKDDSSNKNEIKKSGGAKNNQKGSINRTTVMLILITSLFILSYLPYMTVVFFRLTQPDKFETMGKASSALYHFFYRSVNVNCAANAIIYSLCDYKFRKESLKLFRCKK